MYCLPYSDTGDIIKKGHLVTKIRKWGPEYKIQFKIKLNGPFPATRVPQDQEPYYNFVLFAKNATHCRWDEYGCRIPAVHFRQVGNKPQLNIMVGKKRRFGEYWQWKKWYTIFIEHKVKDGKGTLTVTKWEYRKARVMWTLDDTEAKAYTNVFWFQSSPWHDSVADFADFDFILVENNGKILKL